MAIRLRTQYQQQGQPGAPAATGVEALKIVNYEDGSDARYDVSKMAANPDGTYSYGGYNFDAEGRPLGSNTPGQWDWTEGLPGARGGGGGGGGAATGGGGGGLTGSPYYQQVLAATNSAAAADAAARRTALQQALIGFGLVPEGFQDKYGDIDALTRDLAAKNTSSGISTHARMLQARADAIRQFSRGLSAKGMRRSGAKGYGLRRRQLEFDQGYSDALQKLLGYTGGLYNQFASNEYQRQLGLAQALAYASQQMGNYSAPAAYSAPSISGAPDREVGISSYITSGRGDPQSTAPVSSGQWGGWR